MRDSIFWGRKSSALTDTLFRVPRQNGLQAIQMRGEGGVRELSSWRLRLDQNESTVFRSEDTEAVFVLQEGAAQLRVSENTWDVSRKGVFEQKASALYLPPHTSLTVRAHASLEGLFVTAPAPASGSPALVTPDEIEVNQRGTANYVREVHDIFVRDSYAKRLLVGETFNPPGNWSSYPPHKHDGKDGEPQLEEVYHYRVDPPAGFGHQSIYTADGESITHLVRDGDAVLIPYGYHPVSAAPGYSLYYLWALVGEQRELAVFEDPQHSWITAS